MNAPRETDAFDAAVAAESASADLYGFISRRLSHIPDLRALFSLLEQEERSHARRMREFARRLPDQLHTKLLGLDTKRIQDLTERIRTLHGDLSELEGLDPDEMIRVAVGISNDFECAHAETMAVGHYPLLSAFFAAMAENDHGHLALRRRMMCLDLKQNDAFLTAPGGPSPQEQILQEGPSGSSSSETEVAREVVVTAWSQQAKADRAQVACVPIEIIGGAPPRGLPVDLERPGNLHPPIELHRSSTPTAVLRTESTEAESADDIPVEDPPKPAVDAKMERLRPGAIFRGPKRKKRPEVPSKRRTGSAFQRVPQEPTRAEVEGLWGPKRKRQQEATRSRRPPSEGSRWFGRDGRKASVPKLTMAQRDDTQALVEEAPPANVAQAARHFEIGLELMREGDLSQALDQWRIAAQLDPANDRYVFNIRRLERKAEKEAALDENHP